MTKIDLKALSLAELKSLQSRVERALERYDKKRKTDAIAVIKAKAKEMGFSLSELAGTKSAGPKSSKAKGAAKPKKAAKAAYRHPDDASKTWAGRGARPAWLRDELAAGKPLENFKV